MPDIDLEIDPCNPAEVYACCGLWELMALAGEAGEGRFALDAARPREAHFVLNAPGNFGLADAARSLRGTTAVCLQRQPDMAQPAKDPVAPVRLTLFDRNLTLDWWLTPFWDDSNEFKCWAGQVTSKKLFDELPRLIDPAQARLDKAVYATTRIGLDPRGTWRALQVGYSLNEQGQAWRTYPLAESLAAIGMQSFRPRCQQYRCDYWLWQETLPLAVARTAMLGPWSGLASKAYRFPILRRGRYKFFDFAKIQEDSHG